ncbi:MAG TPA: hypothetical protein VHG27_09240 [Xanthobacteraceae bacterium]|nr:hypothetical protein [Xanthobacteraceae bacterium]
MFRFSPRFLLSPRFLALPAIALAVIIALAQTSGRSTSTGVEVAGPKIYRAVNCSDPANAATAACTVAGDASRTVR